MRKVLLAAAGLAACAWAVPASAAPLPRTQPGVDAESLVTQVQGYKYRRDCVWIGTGWGYKYGGKQLVCRPYKPVGSGWYWHSEGNRHGWYHRKRKHWHYDKW